MTKLTIVPPGEPPSKYQPMEAKLGRALDSIASGLEQTGREWTLPTDRTFGPNTRAKFDAAKTHLDEHLQPAGPAYVQHRLARYFSQWPAKGSAPEFTAMRLAEYVQALHTLPKFALDAAFEAANARSGDANGLWATVAQLKTAAQAAMAKAMADQLKLTRVLAAKADPQPGTPAAVTKEENLALYKDVRAKLKEASEENDPRKKAGDPVAPTAPSPEPPDLFRYHNKPVVLGDGLLNSKLMQGLMPDAAVDKQQIPVGDDAPPDTGDDAPNPAPVEPTKDGSAA